MPASRGLAVGRCAGRAIPARHATVDARSLPVTNSPAHDDAARRQWWVPGAPRLSTWARRLILLLTAGLVIALPLAWVGSQYEGKDIGAAISWTANDGWCHAGYTPPGFGIHCFGDYAQAVVGAQIDFGLPGAPLPESIPGVQPGAVYTSLYPPIGQFPHVTAALAASSEFGRERTFYTYMILLALAVFAPSLWVAWRWRRSPFLIVPVILIGVAAVPVFAMLDRGNSAGFVVPFVLAFAVLLGRDPPWAAPGAVVAAALVRPQFILLSVGLLAVRQWRRALLAVGVFAAFTLASFALMPGGFSASFQTWYQRVSGFNTAGAASVASDSPANPSIARSATALAGWSTNAPSVIGEWAVAVMEQFVSAPLIPVAIIVAITGVLFVFAAGAVPRSIAVVLSLGIASLAPGVTPVYYLIFAVVIAGLVLTDASDDGSAFLPSAREWWSSAWGWLLIAAVALSLTPITLAADAPEGVLPRHSYVLENIGRLWLLVLVAGLVLLAAATFTARRSRAAD